MTGVAVIEHAARTDVGVRRPYNQDDYAVDLASDGDRYREHGHLFVVADGMGGHAVGEKASAKAARDIPHTYRKHCTEGPALALRRAFLEANSAIYAIGQENAEFRGLGTTGTALLLRPEGAWVANVGDSRVYRIRRNTIHQLTFDHSALWEIARRRGVKPEEVQGIRSNIILRSLGPDPTVEVDIEGPHPVLPGDTFVLCSDGLTAVLADAEVGTVVGALNPAQAADYLVDLANLAGGPDNITVIVVRAGQDDGAPRNSASPSVPAKHAPRSIPWPLTTLVLGMLLGIIAVMLEFQTHSIWAKGLFPFAVVAVAAGLWGLLSRKGGIETSLPSDTIPDLHHYSSADCPLDLTLVQKVEPLLDEYRLRLQMAGVAIPTEQIESLRQQTRNASQAGNARVAFENQSMELRLLSQLFLSLRGNPETLTPTIKSPN